LEELALDAALFSLSLFSEEAAGTDAAVEEDEDEDPL